MTKPPIFVILLTLAAHAQFVSVSGGGVVTQDRNATARVDFSASPILAVDAGLPAWV